MRSIILILILACFASYGQNELTIEVSSDSIQMIRTKEEIGRKTFKKISKTYRLKFDYNDFVNPGKDFNTTDISAPPNCRLIVAIRSRQTLLILYEYGSYFGPLTQCIAAVSNKHELELFTLPETVKSEGELLSLIQQRRLKVEKVLKN